MAGIFGGVKFGISSPLNSLFVYAQSPTNKNFNFPKYANGTMANLKAIMQYATSVQFVYIPYNMRISYTCMLLHTVPTYSASTLRC